MDVNKQLLNALKMVLDDPDALDGRPRTYKCVIEAIAAAEQAQQGEPVQTGHCAACNIETGTVRPCDICGGQTVPARQAEPVAWDVLMALAVDVLIKSGSSMRESDLAAIVDRYATQPPAVAVGCIPVPAEWIEGLLLGDRQHHIELRAMLAAAPKP